MLWIDIEILLIALDDQFLLGVTLEIDEFVTLPGYCAVEEAISNVFSFNEVMVDSGTYMCHIDAAKQTMPVGIVSLGFPEVNCATRLCCSSCIHTLVNA